MPPEIQTIANYLIGPALVAFIGYLFVNGLKKRVSDVEKIPNLEARVNNLEQQSILHNETKFEVVRLTEQVKHLAEEVRTLSGFLMRKEYSANV